MNTVGSYLAKLEAELHLDAPTRERVIREMSGHLQEKVDELRGAGRTEEAAAREATAAFGEPGRVARQMYEACSSGGWTETLLTFLPHFVAACLFAAHLWSRPLVAGPAGAVIALGTLAGWRAGSPRWLYSWAGYSLFFLFLAGFLTRRVPLQAAAFVAGNGAAPAWWAAAGVLALYVVSTLSICLVTARAANQDWILASLMLVPLPVLGTWLVTVEQAGGLAGPALSPVPGWDLVMGRVLFLIGLAGAAFIRLRRRVVKAGAVITIGILSGSIVVYRFCGRPGLAGLLAAAVALFLFLVSPAVLEGLATRGRQHREDWARSP